MRNVVNFKLRSDGEEFVDGFKVKSIVITNETNRIPRANIILLDGDVSKQDFVISNHDFFKPGRNLEIDVGFESEVENVFKGVIVRMAIQVRESNASYLEVVCKHPVVKLTTTKQSRLFNEVTDNDAIAGILSEINIPHSLAGMDEFVHTQLVQYESSGWDFILSRVEANAALILFDNEKLNVSAPSMDEESVVKCEYGLNVFTFNALLDGERPHSAVEGKAWSSSEQALVVEEADSSFKNRIGNISSEELAAVLNERSYEVGHTANLPPAEVALWAKSKAMKNELSMIVGHVSIRGTASVFPGKVIELSGFGDRFSGRAFVTGVRHEVSDGGWKSYIQFGLPPTTIAQQPTFNSLPAGGALPAVNGLQTGVVTEIEGDPENEYRIRVRVPDIGSEDAGIWAQQAKLSAGADYGTCFSPEIGDEVVVGFMNDDPRKPVILGVLHSSAKPSPMLLRDENSQKAIISRNGLKIVWDDDKKTIVIATPAGQQITLDDSNNTILLEDSSRNKIEMAKEGIAFESVKNLKFSAGQDIELEGINIKCKAAGKFTAEGNGGAEVRTNSIAVLKGSLVQIN